MRKYIDIIEEVEKARLSGTPPIDFDQWYEMYGLDVAEGSGILDDLHDDIDDVTEKDIRSAIESRFPHYAEASMAKLNRPLYRGMTVTSDRLNGLLSGNGEVGVHWSIDMSVAERFSHEGDAPISIIMKATAEDSAVDLGRTIYLTFLNYEEESEVRLKYNTPVLVEQIFVRDPSGKETMHNVGRMMSTGKENWHIAETHYHGSQSENPQFVIGHQGNNSSTIGGDYSSKRYGVFLTDNPEFARLYGTVGEYQINARNILRERDIENEVYSFIDTLDPFGDDRDVWLSAREVAMGHWSAWQLFENELGERFTRYLLDQGYDAVEFQESNESDDGVDVESKTTVVLDPSLVVRK